MTDSNKATAYNGWQKFLMRENIDELALSKIWWINYWQNCASAALAIASRKVYRGNFDKSLKICQLCQYFLSLKIYTIQKMINA